MSAIFLSHSSTDNEAAARIKAKLEAWDYDSVFLDFDPAHGIPAGRHWERELYAQLRSCEAVLVLCSPASMASSWCFAEITHAKALGKRVFPIKIADCEVHGLLTEFQIVDATREPDAALERLRSALERAGVGAHDLFPWKRDRAPYPGLGSFDRDDAGTYFGRDRDIRTMLEKLTTWRRLPGARLALIVGASGSGKSSLARAGVLPRLAREPARWLVLDPFRPQGRPMDQLAIAVDSALTRAGQGVGWRRVREILQADEPTRSNQLNDLCNDLRVAAGQPDATIIITIDQAEELFTLTPSAEVDAFLAAVKTCVELPGNRVLALATLRSDFLAAWQQRPAHCKPAIEQIGLEQMGRENFREVIQKPATVAAIDLEPGLVEEMVHDTGTQDALPLLAFALNALWRKLGADSRWTLDEYQSQLGGLHGAIAKAAESLLDEAKPSLDEEKLLRRAFSAMVRVNDADQYVRRPARWLDLPEKIRPLLDRFEQARLLVVGGESEDARTVEVAHEALFRSWGRLAVWLNEDREFFLWRRRLEAAVAEWRANLDPSLAWSGAPLAQAERFLLERRDFLDATEREFIAAGTAKRKTAERRRRAAVTGLAAGLVIALGLLAFAGYQWRNAVEQERVAEEQTHRALARQLARDAELAFGDTADALTLSTLLAIESLRQSWTVDAYDTLFRRLDLLPSVPTRSWAAHANTIRGLAASANGQRIATSDGTDVAVWELATGRELRRFAPVGAALGEQQRNPLALSPDGVWLAAACRGHVCIWNVDDGSPQPPIEAPHMVLSLDFSSDGKTLALPGRGEAVLFEVGTWRRLASVRGRNDKPVFAAAFADAANLIVLASLDGLSFTRVDTGATVAHSEVGAVESVAFSRSGETLAAGRLDGREIELWRFAGGQFGPSLRLEHAAQWRTLSVGDDANYLSAAPSARVWNILTRTEVMRLAGDVQVQAIIGRGSLVTAQNERVEVRAIADNRREFARLDHASAVVDVDFAADGRTLATASGRHVRVFETKTWTETATAEVTQEAIDGIRLSFDGRLAAAWEGSTTSLLELASAQPLHVVTADTNVNAATFNPDGRVLAVATFDSVKLVQTMAPHAQVVIGHGADWIAFSPDGRWLATFMTKTCPTQRIHYNVIDVLDARTGASRVAHSQEADKCRDRDEGLPATQVAETDSQLSSAKGWLGVPASTELGHVAALPYDPMTPDGHWRVSTNGLLEDLPAARGLLIVRHDGNVLAAEFSPDGRWLLTGGDDKTARVWPLLAEDLIAIACARVTRKSMTGDEWSKYRPDAGRTETCAQARPTSLRPDFAAIASSQQPRSHPR